MLSFENLSIVIKASRPTGWGFGPILFGIGMLHSQLLPRSKTGVVRALCMAFALSAPLCMSKGASLRGEVMVADDGPVVFGVNDVYDYETDVLNSRKYQGSTEGEALLPKHHKVVQTAGLASSLSILLSAVLVGNHQTIQSTTLLLLFGWQYSAPPLRLKEVPLLDSASNGLIVLLCIIVGFTLTGSKVSALPGKDYALAGICAGIHAVGAAADYRCDLAADQRTIATFFGKRAAITLAFLT